MNRDLAGSLAFASRAVVRRTASQARLTALVGELERAGAEVELDRERCSLRFSFPCRYERWILLGGLADLLDRFEDVAIWDPAFEEIWPESGTGTGRSVGERVA